MGIEVEGTIVSRDAGHSTYAPHTPTPEEANAYPPPGNAVEQTLGAPPGGVTQGATARDEAAKSSKKTAKSES